MKKHIQLQIAFAVTLFVLAVIGSIWKTEYLANIIYAVVVPAFILSVLSFIDEISVKCEGDAEKTADVYKKLAELLYKNAELKLELYNKGYADVPYIEGQVPAEIYKMKVDKMENVQNSLVAINVQMFCLKLQKWRRIFTTCGYVILFLALIMAPYMINILSIVDLNCITLWSLMLLYVSLELKEEICARVYKGLYILFQNKRKEA